MCPHLKWSFDQFVINGRFQYISIFHLLFQQESLPGCILQHSPIYSWWPEWLSWGSRWKKRTPCWRYHEPTAPETKHSFNKESQKIGEHWTFTASSCDFPTLYLVGMYGISMFISINHSQWDRHGVTNKCYGYCVSSDVRESFHGRHLWPWKSEDERVKSLSPGHNKTISVFQIEEKKKKITQLGCGQLSQCCKKSPARRHRQHM